MERNLVDNRYSQSLQLFSEKIGYTFQNPELLHCVLAAVPTQSFKKLEFIGDGQLTALMRERANKLDGRASVADLHSYYKRHVNNAFFARRARDFGFEKYFLNRLNHVADSDTILADCFEALIGAIYTDCNYKRKHAYRVAIMILQPSLQVRASTISRLETSPASIRSVTQNVPPVIAPLVPKVPDVSMNTVPSPVAEVIEPETPIGDETVKEAADLKVSVVVSFQSVDEVIAPFEQKPKVLSEPSVLVLDQPGASLVFENTMTRVRPAKTSSFRQSAEETKALNMESNPWYCLTQRARARFDSEPRCNFRKKGGGFEAVIIVRDKELGFASGNDRNEAKRRAIEKALAYLSIKR